ncbi:MAG: fused MFS/spermidine synthase [Planctomycetota bacterium]
MERLWPGSRVDVVEIDAGVTKAAMEAFGLETDTTINTFTMDARNYINQLCEHKQGQGQAALYDFIYEDALNDYSVPYQLTTKEFNDKIAGMLTDTGAYMIELIDIYDSGLFVGSFVNTLEQTFGHVYVMAENEPRSARNTFVIIAAKRELDLADLREQEAVREMDLWILNGAEINILKQKAGRVVLTDDYAPVENMLAPVVSGSAAEFLSQEYHERALEFKRRGKLDRAVAEYETLIEIDPTAAMPAYNEIAMIRTRQDKLAEAAEAFQQLVSWHERTGAKANIANVHLDLGFLLKKLEQYEDSREHFLKARQGFRRKLTKGPSSPETVYKLGVSLAEVGEVSEATRYFEQAVDRDPSDMEKHSTLAQALVIQGRFDEAIQRLRMGIGFMQEQGRTEEAAELQVYLNDVELRRLKATE